MRKSTRNLLLSPHPDDLVFSAFSALTKCDESDLIVVFFNVSKFTRWPIRSRKLVTLYRTTEDRAILRMAGAKNVAYLFARDNSLEQPNKVGDWSRELEPPESILSPLGIGNNQNHVFVRNEAVKQWKIWSRSPRLLFYEDLPYAAKISNPEAELKSLIASLETECGPLKEVVQPLSPLETSRKKRLCKAYYSQTDYSELIAKHASLRGKETGFAELFFQSI